jgi:hypothetical protein
MKLTQTGKLHSRWGVTVASYEKPREHYFP